MDNLNFTCSVSDPTHTFVATAGINTCIITTDRVLNNTVETVYNIVVTVTDQNNNTDGVVVAVTFVLPHLHIFIFIVLASFLNIDKSHRKGVETNS